MKRIVSSVVVDAIHILVNNCTVTLAGVVDNEGDKRSENREGALLTDVQAVRN